MSKRSIYWLCEEVSTTHRSKAKSIGRQGYDVRFFNTYQSLCVELKKKRASLIIVGDETSESQLKEFIISLSVMPELQGARFVLSISRYRPQILKLAAACSFRDVIPLNIADDAWVLRFIYAASGQKVDIEKPQPQITLNEISAIHLPARVVWMNESHIHIETRVRPEIGAPFSLSGELPKSLGVKTISLKAVERSKTNLVYRFSDGLTAQWTVPQAKQEYAQEQVKNLRTKHFGKRNKIFIAIQSTQLRQKLLGMIEPLDFVLSIALKKKSLIYEPFYFGPDLIIAEQRLLSEDSFKRYIDMVKKLSRKIPIFVIGQQEIVDQIHDIDPNRSVYSATELNDEFLEKIYEILHERDVAEKSIAENAVYFDSKSPISTAEIRFPARLRQIHPSSATLDLPFAVGNFALARMDSPLVKKIIKRSPTLKITDSYKRSDELSSPFKYRVESLFSDVFQNEKGMLTTGLLDFVQRELTARMQLSQPAEKPKKDIEPKEKKAAQPASRKPEALDDRFKPNEVFTEEEASDQMISIIQEAPRPEEDLKSTAALSPIHIEASDYTYKPLRKDKFDGPIGRLIGSKRNLNIIVILGFLSFVAATLYFTKVYIDRDWGKDQGKVFVDSLRGYAPKAFERGLPKKKENLPNEKK